MNDILIICMSIDSGAANVYTIDTNYNSHSPGGMDMTFAERLRRLREQRGYTQAELAEAAGVTPRTVQYYESGKRYPSSLAIAVKLAELLGTTSEHLLGEEGGLILDAQEKGGKAAGRELRRLVEGLSALFAGGELTDEDRDAAMRALTQAYWIAKDDSKKYGSKK